MTYEQLTAHAEEIYQKAVESFLSAHYRIHKRGDRYYSPTESDMFGYQTDVYSRRELEQRVHEAEQKFADVPAIFNAFGGLPDPGGFDGGISSAKATMARLSVGTQTHDPIDGSMYPANTGLADMTSAARYLDEWDGLAAMAFMEGFVTPFSMITLNQFTVAAILMNALRAEQSLWTEARKNIDTIAEDTIKALDHMNDCGKNEWEMAFSVVAAVVAISALTVASGGTAAFALGAVAAAGGVASTVAGQIEDPPKPRFSGESAEAVVASCRKAVEDLTTYIQQAEQKVVTAMSDAASTVAANREDFVSPRPRLADATHATGRGDIGHPDSD